MGGGVGGGGGGGEFRGRFLLLSRAKTLFVSGACGKGKRTSGNTCQHPQYSWKFKYSRKSCTLSRAQRAQGRFILRERVESL